MSHTHTVGKRKVVYQSDVCYVMLVGKKEDSGWKLLGGRFCLRVKTKLMGSRIFRSWNSHLEREQAASTEGVLAK